MNLLKRVVIITIIALVGTLLSAAIPEWYKVEFYINPWFYGNEWEISDNADHENIGNILISRADNWWEYRNAGAIWNGNITLMVSTPFPSLRLRNVEDSSKYFPATIDLPGSKNFPSAIFPDPASPSSPPPYFLPIDLPLNKTGTTQVYLSFDLIQEPEYEGSYTGIFDFEFFVDYGMASQISIAKATFDVFVYYIRKSGDPGTGIFTNLIVEAYPEADQIDIPQLQLSGNSLKVGWVSFSSDDNNSTSNYFIEIGPGDPYPVGDIFAFYKNSNPSVYIPYKVAIPGREVISPSPLGSQTGTFSVEPPDLLFNDYWSDFFDIYINQMNYNDRSYSSGEYTSLILIKLIKN